MKRLFSILSLVIIGLISVSCYDDSALWDSFNDHEKRIKDLETRVNEMNTNLSSLQSLVSAMKQGDYITEVKPLTEDGVEIGYQITFSERGTIVIYHGEDGVSSGDVPEFGAKQDADGVYYWTINGEWVLDDKGNKLPVSSVDGGEGIVPELKIENDKWYVSYDGGNTWEELGNVASSGGSGCLFKDVKLTDDALVLTMSDGTVYTLPIGQRFRIVLGDFDVDAIQYGVDVVIPYTIEGAGEASVFVLSDGWMFEAELVEETSVSGTITIRQDDYYDKEIGGKVAIFAVAEDGTTVSKVIRLVSGVLYPASESYNHTYLVDAEGGQVDFTVSTNREVEVKTNADWVVCASTKAVEEKTLVFDVAENEGGRRKAEVEISSGDIDFTFTITQKGFGDEFAVELTCDAITVTGKEVCVDTLYNKAGQTIYEALGYSSWEEVAKAAGDWEAVYNRTGEVLLRAYDLYTGDALPYDEVYRNGLGFRHNAEGYLVDSGDYYQSSWNWWTVWTDEECLSNNFQIILNHNYARAGESYSFGILLTSPEGEARIEVTINVVEYEDPEKGLYDSPADPGKYEFAISDVIDLDEMSATMMMHKINNGIAETIKSTLGKTSYELYKEIGDYEIDVVFELSDGSRWNGKEIARLDKNGYWSDYGDNSAVDVQWYFGANPMSPYLEMMLPISGWDNGPIFTDAVYNAIGQTIEYYYIIRTEDHELVFTHDITFEGTSPSKTWYIVGTFNDWTTGDSAYLMTEEDEWYVYYNFTTSGDELKFNTGSWDKNRGSDCFGIHEPISVWQDAMNIMIPAGTYDIYLSKTADYAYFMTPGCKPGDALPGTNKVVFWENDDTSLNVSWDSRYRFGLEGTDTNGECLATFSPEVWSIIKEGTFYLHFKADEYFQIRVTDAWWSAAWTGSEVTPGNQMVINNGDGTYDLRISFAGDPIKDVLDMQHLLFTGGYYTPLDLYYLEVEENVETSRYLTGINVSVSPTAQTYVVYDDPVRFNPDGMEVLAEYSDGSYETIDIADLTFSDVEPGADNVTINYNEFSTQVGVKVVQGTDALGQSDCSSAWWTTFTDDFAIAAGESKVWKMMCYTLDVCNNWNAPCTILRKADYTEYAVFRMDHYGWGDSYEGCTLESNWNWDVYVSSINMSTIVLTVTNNGDDMADVSYDVTYANGEEHYQTYKNVAIDSSDFMASLTVDNCYLVFFE